MRKLFLVCVLGPCLVVLVGCPKKKEDAPDAEVAPPVATTAATPALAPAKNVADIARFPNAEKPVTDDQSKLVDFVAQVRTAPKSGNLVATLKAGVDPVKIAEHQDCFLIQFPDPKDPNSQLMGWIAKGAFTADPIFDAGKLDAAKDAAPDVVVVDAAPKPFTCLAGQEAVVNIARDPVCRKKCTADKDCKNPTPNSCSTAQTVGGKAVKVCAGEAP